MNKAHTAMLLFIHDRSLSMTAFARRFGRRALQTADLNA
jgi:hypothetical protein